MAPPNAPRRASAAELERFASTLLGKAGMAADRAADVASILVEGDLMGHSTHGLQLLPSYLAEATSGSMTLQGEPVVLADRGASLTWDGRRLPGPWLVLRAMEEAERRAREFGTGTVVIRRSHHIGCLAAYLRRSSERGFVMLLHSSAPANSSVAPHGGTKGVLSPSPISAGIPTEGLPILVDISTSSTSNGLVGRTKAAGGRLPHPWLVDAEGRATDDPAKTQTILPLGGLDNGHKGFGLGLMVDALTSGLAGHGRLKAKENLGASVFLQVFDPEGFGGSADLRKEMQGIVDGCAASPAPAGGEPVRMPGERGQKLRERQLAEGVELLPSIVDGVAAWAAKLGVQMPAGLAGA